MSTVSAAQRRVKRHESMRNKIVGTSARPRMSVFRSTKHICVQIIDDSAGKTLAAASSYEKEIKSKNIKGMDLAKEVGTVIGNRAKSAGIDKVVFDRGGFKYHGRVAAVADAAREAGLEF